MSLFFYNSIIRTKTGVLSIPLLELEKAYGKGRRAKLKRALASKRCSRSSLAFSSDRSRASALASDSSRRNECCKCWTPTRWTAASDEWTRTTVAASVSLEQCPASWRISVLTDCNVWSTCGRTWSEKSASRCQCGDASIAFRNPIGVGSRS